MPVNVVLGAGGPTGLQCVQRLLQATDQPVRAVVRDPAKHEAKLAAAATAAGASAADRLQVVAGDVTDPASLKGALKDAAGVIFAAAGSGFWSAAEVDNKGVGNVIEAAREAGGVTRVVLVSSMLTHPSNRFSPIRVILNNIRWSLMDHKFAGEELLRHSGLPFTVVRPAGLSNKPPGLVRLAADINTTRESANPGSISRADVAAVCVEALTNPAAVNKTISIYASKGGEPLPPPAAGGDSLAAECRRLFGEALAYSAFNT